MVPIIASLDDDTSFQLNHATSQQIPLLPVTSATS